MMVVTGEADMGVLTGKTALVTGASRGIGRTIATKLAREGALVAVHFHADPDAADVTLDAIESCGGQAFALRAQLGVPQDTETLYGEFDAGLAKYGLAPRLDILVNNAGTSGSARIDEVTPELFDRIFAVNAKALLFVVQKGLLRMREGGRIINVSSAATRIAYPESVAYAMSKGAVETLTLALAKELGPRGITVNAVRPGFIETDMNRAKRDTPETAAQLASWSVFDRIGQPSDVADIVAFLASGASRWITGQCIDASGGSRL
jgi:3-oxoacyl-[acyl-carrier protein] reductase